MKKVFLSALISIFLISQGAQANSGKAFMMSVLYGTLAGTLVGAATLAFTTNPSDNLNNVARGASYGLYAGILMGLYVNSMDDDSGPQKTEQNPGSDEPPSRPTPVPEQPATPPVEDNNQTLLNHSSHEKTVAFKNGVKWNLGFRPYLLLPSIKSFNGQSIPSNQWGMGVNFLEAKF